MALLTLKLSRRRPVCQKRRWQGLKGTIEAFVAVERTTAASPDCRVQALEILRPASRSEWLSTTAFLLDTGTTCRSQPASSFWGSI